jgi:hypothetical protein
MAGVARSVSVQTQAVIERQSDSIGNTGSVSARIVGCAKNTGILRWRKCGFCGLCRCQREDDRDEGLPVLPVPAGLWQNAASAGSEDGI